MQSEKWHSPNRDVFALVSDAPLSLAEPLGKPKGREVESIMKRCEVSLTVVFAAGGWSSWRSLSPWSLRSVVLQNEKRLLAYFSRISE